jgi:hypothetical protein
MARYNTVISSATASTTAAFTSPGAGTFTKLTGSTYTVTIGDPTLFAGLSQTFYNAASGTITLTFTTAGGGVFTGPGGSGTTSQTMSTGTTTTLFSDGTNWVTMGAGGGPITATTGAFSGQVSTTGATGFNIVSSSTDDSTSDITGAATFAGGVAVNKNITIGKAGNTGRLRMMGSTTGTVTFQAAATTTGGTYTFPAADGTNGYALTTNGSGTLSWSAVGASISDDTSTNAVYYPAILTTTTGNATALKTSSGKFTFNPSTGLLTVTALTESSSITLKENVNPIAGALEAIMSLVGVTYDRRDGSSKNEAGLIAEEVNKIIPNIVSKNSKGDPDGIHYSKLTAYLVEAIKSLKEEINELKGKK